MISSENSYLLPTCPRLNLFDNLHNSKAFNTVLK